MYKPLYHGSIKVNLSGARHERELALRKVKVELCEYLHSPCKNGAPKQASLLSRSSVSGAVKDRARCMFGACRLVGRCRFWRRRWLAVPKSLISRS
jgi:hypothetical protein